MPWQLGRFSQLGKFKNTEHIFVNPENFQKSRELILEKAAGPLHIAEDVDFGFVADHQSDLLSSRCCVISD